MDTIKILIDTKGGDNGASVMIKGAKLALDKFEELNVVLIGDEELIKEESAKEGLCMDRVEVIDAKGEITNFDNPAEALFKKTLILPIHEHRISSHLFVLSSASLNSGV